MTVIIIGSGFAGASCAWWLARLGVRDVIVLEREEMPGLHASGLNAGMARSYEEDETIAPLARRGGYIFFFDPAGGFNKQPGDWGQGVVSVEPRQRDPNRWCCRYKKKNLSPR